MRRTHRCTVVLSLLLALPVGLAAQPQGGDRSSLWTLLLLKGKLVNVSYSPGSLERAVQVQARYGALAGEFANWSGQKIPMIVYVVSREEWRKVGMTLPYGFPARLPMGILTLPAWGDEGTVDLWRDLGGGSLPAGDPSAARGTIEETASLRVGDLLGQVEGARILLENARLRGDELWISELLAHSVTLSVWLRSDPAEAARMEALGRSWMSPAALPLDGYRAGVSMPDWLAYQAAFHAGARQVIEQAGPRGGKALIKLARKRGGRLPAADLFRKLPRLADWHRRTFADAVQSGS